MPTDIFDTFSFELIKWNKSINLIQEKTENTLYERHIKNSLDLKPFINYESDVVLDIGSGAGFPGIILSIDGAKNVHLVEPNKKRVTFLNHIKNLYDLPVTIHECRWQDLDLLEFSIITSRAFASLKDTLEIMDFVSRETKQLKGLFLKGEKIQEETSEAREKWLFEVEIFPSSAGCVAKIERVQKK